MIINVIPQRLIRVTAELRQAERNLIIAANSLEEVIESLKHLGDESMLITAAKLSKTHESLKRKIRAAHLMRTALERIAAVYMRTEDNIRSYEEENPSPAGRRMKAMDMSSIRPRADRTFERL